MNRIVAAREAWETGREAHALDLLLSCWRVNRDDTLATHIAALSARACARFRPSGIRASEITSTQWASWAAEPDCLRQGALLAMLPDLPVEIAKSCIAVLSEWSEDPRVAAALHDLLASPPPAWTETPSQSLWRTVLRVLDHHGDPRSRPFLQGLMARYGHPENEAAFPWLMRRLLTPNQLGVTAPPKPLPPRDADCLSAWREQMQRAREQLTELYAAVYATPTDMTLRMVLSDALQAIDDPHGLFIAEQLRGRRVSPPSRALSRAWLGRIAPVVASATFSNGFPDTVRCVQEPSSDIASLIGLSEWSTVRALDVSEWRDGYLLACTPVMRSLTHLNVGSHHILSSPTAPRGLIRLDIHGPCAAHRLASMLAGTNMKPRSLGLSVWDDADTSLFLPLVHLEQLVLRTKTPRPWLRGLAEVPGSGSLEIHVNGIVLRFERDEHERLSRLEVRSGARRLRQILDWLAPVSLSHATITRDGLPQPAAAASFQATLRIRGILAPV